jgi:hypothetical protein
MIVESEPMASLRSRKFARTAGRKRPAAEAKKVEKVRFTLELPTAIDSILDSIRDRSGLATRTDAIVASIVVCDWALTHVLGGEKIAAVNERRKSYRVLESTLFTMAKAVQEHRR